MPNIMSKVVHSVMARLALIVGAMGLMIGAAVYVSWTVFQSIAVQMTEMTDQRLPQLRTSASVTTATDETRALLTDILIAPDTDAIEILNTERTALMAQFNEALSGLPETQANAAQDVLSNAEAQLVALIDARLTENRAQQDAVETLGTAFDLANAVSARLEEATDNAFFDMTLSGEDAIASIDETLTNLVDRDFAQFQRVLSVQAEINLLTGLGLTLQQNGQSASRAITQDLARSSLDRLNSILASVEGTDELPDFYLSVAEATEAFDQAFSQQGRPPSANQILDLRVQVDSVLSPAVDDVYFNLVIGSDDAKSTTQTALTDVLQTDVAAMRDMAALDAGTKLFFSKALRAALARTPAELNLVQGALAEKAAIVRALLAGISDTDVATNVENLLSLADPATGIAAKRLAVFDAQVIAAAAAAEASGAVGTIGQTTASFSSAALDSIETTADNLGSSVDAAGEQIQQIAMAGMGLFLIAPFLVWLFVTRPLHRVTAVTERLASGDLSEIKGLKQNQGELGRLAKALFVFRENALQTIKMREEEKQREIRAREEEKAAEAKRLAEAEAQKQREQAQEEDARQRAEAERKKMIGDLSMSLGSVVSAASEGDFSRRVDVSFEDPELLGLAQSVNALIKSVDDGLAETARVLSRIADGDLTETMSGDFHGAFAGLQSNTNGMVHALKDLVGEITSSGDNLASSSSELRDTSDALSKQAEQNAASLEETSAALEQLTASIKQVSQNVADANDKASLASATAKSSGVVAADAADAINRISEASKEIGKVVTVINDIAFQINLLALNAGVEAARAGDAGRGFSVVASEVRQLSQRAGEAAKEISDVISKSDAAVSEGVAKVTNAQESLEQISESVIGVSHRIDQISSAIEEQVNGIGEINSAVAQIDTNTQKQAASFEEVTAASSLLSNEAHGLKRSTSRFKTGLENVEDPQIEVPSDEKRPNVQGPSLPAVQGNLATNLDEWDEF